MEECPKISETVLQSVPSSIAWVAKVCLKEWNGSFEIFKDESIE